MGIGLIEAALCHSLRVPEDLAVIGFDEIPARSLIRPQLATVHQPMADKGTPRRIFLTEGKRDVADQLTRQAGHPPVDGSLDGGVGSGR